MVWLIGIVAIMVLAHTAPFPFLLDVTDRTVWRMPSTDPPIIYLTFDDGPNPTATPQLLDVLKAHGVAATSVGIHVQGIRVADQECFNS